MTIKAIETLYRGHYFRSKAEARFAVFLDCLGEIIRDETPEDKAAAIMAKYADREFYMLEIENYKDELWYVFYIRV